MFGIEPVRNEAAAPSGKRERAAPHSDRPSDRIDDARYRGYRGYRVARDEFAYAPR